MNIYLQELKMGLRSVFTWSISICLMFLVFMSIFPSFAKDAAVLNEVMTKMPKELLVAFGMDGLDMSSLMGYFTLIFIFCQICLAIQASNYGFGLVSLEERDLTADFLLAKPVSRNTILTAKLLAAFTNLTITNLVIWASTFGFFRLFAADFPYDSKAMLLILLSIIPFQLFFLAVGVVISLFIRRVRSVTPLSMALAFGMYVLSAFGDMAGKANLEVISPFKHFASGDIIRNNGYDLPLVSFSLAVIVVSLVGSYLLYNRRNIHSVV